MLINSLHTLYNVAIDKVRKVWYNVDTERERKRGHNNDDDERDKRHSKRMDR